MQLRDYQQRILADLYAWFRRNPDGHPIVNACVGAGKSVMIAELCRQALADWPETRIVMVVASRELCQQNLLKLYALWPDAPAGVLSASLGGRDTQSQILFATIGSIAKRAHEIGHVDLLLVDECFPAGTLVTTHQGDVRIEDIKPGDTVMNATGYGVVESVFSKPSRDFVKLELSNGTVIRCTPDHPVFTESGWIEAAQLENGARLFSIEGLRSLWGNVSTVGEEEGCRGREVGRGGAGVDQAEVLLKVLLQESRKPDEQESGPDQNAGNPAPDQAPPHSARRERQAFAHPTACAAARAWGRMGVGSCDSHQDSQGERLPDLLQAGHSERENEDWDRTGRGNPCRGKDSHRQEEDRPLGDVRVDRVSREEQPGDEAVFNLRVSGHPSYFAQGVLVHNCHNVNPAESGMYRTLIADLKRYGSTHLRVIGWTGTPFRGNGVWLQQGDSPLFTAVAATVGMPELLRQGHLSPLVTAQTETRIDTTGVGISNGDYKIGELEARAEEVTDAAIEELVRLGADRKQWLVFCVTIEHAEGVLAALYLKGIDADMVTGKTASAKRNDLINRFKAGKLRCLVNVACLTTGFDAPETDLIALLRPTKSPVLYVQIAGRGMRTAPGKTDCLWLDFTDTTASLGAVDTIRGRNKRVPKEGDSKEKKAPVKLCDGCGNEVPAGVLVCPDCGHEFPPPAPSVNRTASNATILASMAAPEPIRISNVTYRRHQKEGSPDSLRVDYWDGYKVAASEWVCIEHHGYARQKAQLWWERRTCYPFPRTVTYALEITGGLRRPSSITIVKNGKFQEIRGYDFARVAEPEADAGNGDGLDDEGAGAAAGAGLCQLRSPGEERELFPLGAEAAAACAE